MLTQLYVGTAAFLLDFLLPRQVTHSHTSHGNIQGIGKERIRNSKKQAKRTRNFRIDAAEEKGSKRVLTTQKGEKMKNKITKNDFINEVKANISLTSKTRVEMGTFSKAFNNGMEVEMLSV